MYMLLSYTFKCVDILGKIYNIFWTNIMYAK